MSSSSNKAAISLTTGLEDAEKVTVAFLVAVGAAESGRPTLVFLTKEAVRLAVPGVAVGVACQGCPPLPDLLRRYADAGGRFYVCPICFEAKQLDKGDRKSTRLNSSHLGISYAVFCLKKKKINNVERLKIKKKNKKKTKKE